MSAPDAQTPAGEFLLYQTEDGLTRIECRFEADTLWLSQAQMADLFQTSKQNIAKHLKAIFAEGELSRDSVVNQWLTTAADGKRYRVAHYRLEAIIAAGYRVRSHRGTQFRQWATARLDEYLRKGFALDDIRLKNPPGPGVPDYFDELLARIRDIRSSEKVFWRKVLDIYATSIDYDPSIEASQRFFATVQNKMHWAAHGNTAAEIVHSRADASQPNMGMTHWTGSKPGKQEAAIAKNYLQPAELDALNRIVSAYLEFAELQALSRKPMTMQAWIAKLDDYLRLSERDILTHAGTVSHASALQKAELEYEKYRNQLLTQSSKAERDFDAAIKQLPVQRKQPSTRKPKP